MMAQLGRARSALTGRPVLLGAGAVLGVGVLVILAMLLRGVAPVADFISTYHGGSPMAEERKVGAEGFPAWVTWQHFLNFFLLAMIIRTGIASRAETRPVGYWAPKGRRGGDRTRLVVFTHLSLDVLWMLNGFVYVVLLFVTGRWARIVPTSWEVIPNSISVAIQYLSLNWPTENSWAYYNSLQQIAYFAVVFILAPASFATGWRLSPLWPKKWESAVPIDKARMLHFPLMIGFVVFVVCHIGLVLLTGALRNLNHMFAGIDNASSWTGAIMCVILVIITAGCTWVIARPGVMRTWGALLGNVTR